MPTSGKRFAVDLPRSKILSTRLLFRAGPKVKKNWSETARVQNTRALTDVRLRRRTSRARTRSARLRPRADPSARRWNQTPADRRPSQRPRRRSFFTSTRKDRCRRTARRSAGPPPRSRARARAPGGHTMRPPHGSCRCGRPCSSCPGGAARSARELRGTEPNRASAPSLEADCARENQQRRRRRRARLS